MFRGKESTNRIEISRLVQDLLNFGVLGSLWLWVGGRWVGASKGVWEHLLGAWGVSPHACKCMYRNCKWPLTWRHPCLSFLACMCVHAYMHACMHVHVCMGHPPTHLYS